MWGIGLVILVRESREMRGRIVEGKVNGLR